MTSHPRFHVFAWPNDARDVFASALLIEHSDRETPLGLLQLDVRNARAVDIYERSSESRSESRARSAILALFLIERIRAVIPRVTRILIL